MTWEIQNMRTPLIINGCAMVIINIAKRIMNGVAINQVSRNWRWESRISTLRTWLRYNPVLMFSHVKRSGNKVSDTLANEGVGKE